MRRAVIIGLTAAALSGFFVGQVQAAPNAADATALDAILSAHKSPLPDYTILAFAKAHPGFSIANYLTVMQCESGMGTTGLSAKWCNPGNIIWGGRNPFVAKPWLTLQTGYFLAEGGRKFGRYPDMYTGQRAAILLLWAHYMPIESWQAFADVWYGKSVPGLAQYVQNLEGAHASIVKQAAKYGAKW